MQQGVAESPATPAGSRLWSWIGWGRDDTVFIAEPRTRIFFVSFTMLFFELLCIRWIPAYIRYLGYFNNFILLASFLGMGLGILAARRQRFFFPPFPLLLLVLVAVVGLNRFDLPITSTDVLYFGAPRTAASQAEHFWILPVVFTLVAAAFIPLARQLGLLLQEVKPLTAYTFDIIGSLAGIASFFLISYFSLPPLVWFALLAALVLALSKRRQAVLAGLLLLTSLTIAYQLQQGAYWSPYYKVVLRPIPNPPGYTIDVNNVGHQAMMHWEFKEPFYRRVYELFPNQPFNSALVLGAGSGTDVATALAHDVQSVTAVEIDPVIQDLGRQYNPDHPYDDPRVKVVIDDGRAFLRNTDQKYDLIVFALPDSLTLTSSMTSLRLESFLLTQDAIATARDRLTDNGVVVLYNYYREPWLIEKLAGMVGRTFGQDPYVSSYGGWGRAAVIIAGPRLSSLPAGSVGPYREDPPASGDTGLRVIGQGLYPVTDRRPATDDWPFLYLPARDFPRIYIAGLAMVLVVTLLGLLPLAPRRTLRHFDWHMFFLGVAFALLEVKSLITFALLFGSTWMVNSLVFFAILSSVLLAVLVNSRFQVRRIGIFYLLLFGALALNFLVPPQSLLFDNPTLRYLSASLLAFAPVFLANVIFSNSFRDTEQADVAFASNLLGIMLGGMLEYFSMLTGYHLLLLPVIVFYALALLLRRRPESLAQATVAGSLATAET